jgi:hypothetical protein
MSVTNERVSWWGDELETAHRLGVNAAAAGLQDPGLGALRLSGTAVPSLAEAAVSTATPFLRAPLLSRIFGVLALHPEDGDADGRCPSCGVSAPCATAEQVRR